MDCPNCKTKMECEQMPTVVGTSMEELRRTGRDVKLIPAAHYYCPGCDSEWVWTKGVSGIRQVDGATYDQRHNEPYWWRQRP